MAKEQPEEIFVGPACMAVLGDRVRVAPDSLGGSRCGWPDPKRQANRRGERAPSEYACQLYRSSLPTPSGTGRTLVEDHQSGM